MVGNTQDIRKIVAYNQSNRKLSLKHSKIGCLVAIVLVPAGVSLDWFVYPGYVGVLFLIRVACDLGLALIYFLHQTQYGRERPFLLIVFWTALVDIAICGMIFVTEGSLSPYYAGLNLVVICATFLLPLTLVQAITIASVVLICYVFTLLIHGSLLVDFSTLYNNLYFLVLTGIISAVACFFNEKRRKKEFFLQYELDESYKALAKLDEMKSRFFANASHELRTPLVALSSTLQLIESQSLDPKKQTRLLSRCREELAAMLEIISDLLLKTRSEKGMLALHYTKVNIEELVSRLLIVFEPIANQHQTTLSLTSQLNKPLIAYVDVPRFRKIINNLVGNAVKFTQEGSIDVLLSSDDKYYSIAISDTGSGIPTDELETIFQPFSQASNNSSRDVEGTGIGLSLVKDLVDLHKGSIHVESSLGKGSCFTLFFPLECEGIKTEQPFDLEQLSDISDSVTPVNMRYKSFEDLDLSPFEQKIEGRPTVLLVEDNPQIIQLLAYVLCDDYNLEFSKDGETGITLTKSLKPDLVISDVMMPKKNGFQLVEEIRQDKSIKGIPVILLTSKQSIDDRIEGFLHGADDYISKPFNNQEVRTRVGNLIKRKRLEVELVQISTLASIGQLASGIAHEINNPMSFTHSSAEVIADILDEIEHGQTSYQDQKNTLRKAIGRVIDGAKRVINITDALRTTAYQGSEKFTLYDIHIGIDASLEIVHSRHKRGVNIDKQYGLTAEVPCNNSRINQVLINILQNALDAVAKQNDAKITIKTYQENDTAVISITDNGPGIPEAIEHKIFQPFFTTKPITQGTGLGLSICKRIVEEEHSGDLFLNNKQGQGVTWLIRLPLTIIDKCH